MISFKKTITSIILAISFFSVSAIAAEDNNAKVKKAGEETIASVESALNLAKNGGDKAEILKLFADARQTQKEFRYEQTERMRQKAGDRLKVAKEEVEAGKASSVEAIQATLDMYKEMMKVYLAAH